MPQKIAGAFTSASAPNRSQISDVLVVPSPVPPDSTRIGLLNISGELSASNTVTVQYTPDNGLTWVTIGSAFTSAQTNLQLAMMPTRQYRLVCDMQQAGKTIHYSLSAEG